LTDAEDRRHRQHAEPASPDVEETLSIRLNVVIALACVIGAIGLGASRAKDAAAGAFETPDQIIASALRQAIGAPARADIDDQATVRLSEDLIIVPRDSAVRLLTVRNTPLPPDLQALLYGSEGLEAPGVIRFVSMGFIDADQVLGWTADDLLSSLNSSVEAGNPDRLKNNLHEREARQWVLPPRYNRETHQLSWAALIVPKSAPRDSDGETTYHAIGFGREGYVELTVVSSVQKAESIGHMVDDFLIGLNFRPGKAYGDALRTDRRAPNGLAGAMEVNSLHKAPAAGGFWASDTVIALAGGIVATIGALALMIYVRRHLRQEARRI
jgi:uncharacterized membrane-anchored protein